MQGFSSPSLKLEDVIVAVAAFAQNLIIYEMPVQHAITETYGGRRRLLSQTFVTWVELVDGVSCTRQLTSEQASELPWSLPPPPPCSCKKHSRWTKAKDHRKAGNRNQRGGNVKRIIEWLCEGCKQRCQLEQPEWIVSACRDRSYLWIHPVPLPVLDFVHHAQSLKVTRVINNWFSTDQHYGQKTCNGHAMDTSS